MRPIGVGASGEEFGAGTDGRSGIGSREAVVLGLAVDAQGIESDVSAGELDLHRPVKGDRGDRGAILTKREGLGVAEEAAAVGCGLENTVVGAFCWQGGDVDGKGLGVGTSGITGRCEGEDVGPSGVGAVCKEAAFGDGGLCRDTGPQEGRGCEKQTDGPVELKKHGEKGSDSVQNTPR